MQNLKPLSSCLLSTTVIQTSKCSHCRHHSSSSWLNQPCNSTTSNPTRKIYALKFLCLPQQQEFLQSRWPYFQTLGLASVLLALNILQSEIWIQNILSHVTSLCSWKYETALQKLAAKKISSGHSSYKTACKHLWLCGQILSY